MAEAKEEEPSLPPRGKVQEVCKQWSVHEDGALAYQIQNDEINQHYGVNRFNRRTVRGDIPIAKIVQSEEEIRQQEERMRQLEVLKAQAEADEKVAKKISQQLKEETVAQEECEALDDEELARQLQEREKKKYERHLERKREKRLKKERQLLEAALAKDSEEARLALNQDSGGDQVTASMESLNVQGVSVMRYRSRVTPAGRIEDDGDFSDFYNLPDEMDEFTRLEIQASQDEELARLLQEQEHKRTQAVVDQDKLRNIELQDEQLARVMQEQEKLRLRKAKEKHRAKKEAKRQMSAESMPLGASANSMNQVKQPQQASSSTVSAAVPINNSSGHHRFRRNSYTQAFDSPPTPPNTQPPQRLTSDRTAQVHQQHRVPSEQDPPLASSYSHANQQYHKAQQMMAPPLSSSVSSPRSAYIGPGGGLSTLESARRIAAGDPERIMALQNSHNASVNLSRGLHQERVGPPHDAGNTMDIIRAHSHHNTTKSAERGPEFRQRQADPGAQSQPYPSHHALSEAGLSNTDAGELLRWMRVQDGSSSIAAKQQPVKKSQQHQPGRSGSGSNYTDEEDDPPIGTYPNGSTMFNIATAIDPTYQRRHPEGSYPSSSSEETQLKSHIPFSRSLPQADGELEWDPGLRGSLRKTKAPIHGYQDSTSTGPYGHSGGVGGEPVMSAWQPVQGQRRGDTRSRNKSRKNNTSESDGKRDKGNCKQQ